MTLAEMPWAELDATMIAMPKGERLDSLSAEEAIVAIDTWLREHPQAQPWRIEFYQRQRRWAERCLRRHQTFYWVPPLPSFRFCVHAKGIQALCIVPPKEALRRIKAWRQVWPDIARRPDIRARYDVLYSTVRKRLWEKQGRHRRRRPEDRAERADYGGELDEKEPR